MLLIHHPYQNLLLTIKIKYDPKILNEIASLIKPNSIEIAFGQSQNIENHNKTYDKTDNSYAFDSKDEKIKNDKDDAEVRSG